MAEQINIQVITSSLRKLAKSWAEANRRAQMNKERRQRVEAEAKRLRKPVEQAKPWPGAVPEGGIKPELAAFRDTQAVGVGNAWVWTTDKISKFRSCGSTVLNSRGAPAVGIAAMEWNNKIGSLDGTSWIEWTEAFDASDVIPTPATSPLPVPSYWPSPSSWTLREHLRTFRPQSFGLGGTLGFQQNIRGSFMSAGYQLALPIGPQSMLYISSRRLTFGYQACVASVYEFGTFLPRSVLNFSDTLQTKTVTVQKAFYVGKSTVREVALPSELASLLDAMMPTHVPSLVNVDYDFGATEERSYGDATGVISVPRITWTTVPAANTDNAWLTDHTLNAPRISGLFNNATEIPGLEIAQFGSSASIYPSLIHGSTWEADGDDPQAARAKQKATSVFPLNFGAFAGLSALVPPRQPIDFLYANGGDLYFNGALNSLSASRTPRLETNPPTYSYSDDEDNSRTGTWESRLYTSYDWSDARFCRRQLLALGFSPSDLVP